MGTQVYIVRHGETDWNAIGKLQGREDIPLNAQGQEQAQMLAKYFSELAIDVVASSPLRRAYETAQAIALVSFEKQVHVFENLVERCWGDASGLTPEERRAKFENGHALNEESFEDLQARAMHSIEEIVKNFENKTIVVVSHGAFINAILHAISRGEYGSFKTRLVNASVNKLQFESNTWSVEFYNKTVLAEVRVD